MSRQKFEKTFNTFTKGLMTEASEINFPEDFSLYEKNFVLHRDGGRSRRKGLGNRREVFLTTDVYEWEAATSEVYKAEAVTSTLYPIIFEDGIAPGLVEPSAQWNVWPVESVGVGLLPPAIYRRAAVRYFEYKDGEPESVEIGLLAPSIIRKTVIRRLVYDKAEPEQLSIGLLPPAIFRKKVADRFDYVIPEESISVGLLAPTIKRTNT